VFVFAFLLSAVLGQPYIAGQYAFFHNYGNPVTAAIEASGRTFHLTSEMFTTVALYNSNSYLLEYGGLGASFSVVPTAGGYIWSDQRSVWVPALPTILVDTKVKIDSSGWAVEWQKFENTGMSPITITVTNGFGDVPIYFPFDLVVTESGNTVASTNLDQWALVGVSGVAYVGIANGDFATVFDVRDGQQVAGWAIDPVTLNSGENFSVLRAFVQTDQIPYEFFVLKVDNVVGSANNFYTYVNPLTGDRLLDFLTAGELLSVVNWDFLGAGVGGDPHGVHFDSSHFELRNPGVYCLYHDHLVQVNIRVSEGQNFVKEIVVFVREPQDQTTRVIHARMSEDGSPAYAIDDMEIEIPSSLENGFLVARDGSFKFPGILGELERYHVNTLKVGPFVTIVGGFRPAAGGFFNVALHHRVKEFDFPSILQWHDHPSFRGLDMEISLSELDDIWVSAP